MSLMVNQLVGFGAGEGEGEPVSYNFDGHDLNPDSGLTTDTHTYNSKTTTGPKSVICIGWADGSSQTLTSASINGNDAPILVQDNRSTGENVGCAICLVNGAHSGDVVAVFNGTVDKGALALLSLSNLRSHSPKGTDTAGASSGTGTALTALTGPGDNGIVISMYVNDGVIGGTTWTNATEISDIDASSFLQSVAIVLGNPAGNIIANGPNNDHQIIGVSLR